MVVDRLPVSDELARRAGTRTRAQEVYALAGGEDYELLLAVPPERAAAFERACGRAAQPVTLIGECTRRRTVELRPVAGALLPAPAGFDHFDR